jgi:hypothetical protein
MKEQRFFNSLFNPRAAGALMKLAAMAFALAQMATTAKAVEYYVDYSNGFDTNAGTVRAMSRRRRTQIAPFNRGTPSISRAASRALIPESIATVARWFVPAPLGIFREAASSRTPRRISHPFNPVTSFTFTMASQTACLSNPAGAGA